LNFIDALTKDFEEENYKAILCKLMKINTHTIIKINAPVELIEAIYVIGYESFTHVEKGIIDRALKTGRLNEKT